MNTVTCKNCREEAVPGEHKGAPVLACPTCDGILYRPIGREPAEGLGGSSP